MGCGLWVMGYGLWLWVVVSCLNARRMNQHRVRVNQRYEGSPYGIPRVEYTTKPRQRGGFYIF